MGGSTRLPGPVLLEGDLRSSEPCNLCLWKQKGQGCSQAGCLCSQGLLRLLVAGKSQGEVWSADRAGWSFRHSYIFRRTLQQLSLSCDTPENALSSHCMV